VERACAARGPQPLRRHARHRPCALAVTASRRGSAVGLATAARRRRREPRQAPRRRGGVQLRGLRVRRVAPGAVSTCWCECSNLCP
jgi:hypothetical protein